MSNRKKGVNLINSRTPAEAREHRREVLEAVHECKIRGFSHPESVDALRKQFQVSRDMAREYITWYKQEKQKQRHVDFEEKRRLLWDRSEHIYGKAIELAEISGDYKQAFEITKEQAKWLDSQEKRLATLAPETLVTPQQVSLQDMTQEERALYRRLIEIKLDRQNTSATLVITQATGETHAAPETDETL